MVSLTDAVAGSGGPRRSQTFRRWLARTLWLWCALEVCVDADKLVAAQMHDPPLPQVVTSVTVRTSCEAMVPAYCQGKYGFEAWETGAWQIGPDPDGRAISGYLSQSERQALRVAARRMLQARESVVCPFRQPIPGLDEVVVLQSAKQVIKLRGAGGELNPACILSDVRIAARLFALADRLMRHHYPRPFAGKAAE
jgi:hypothetical protein